MFIELFKAFWGSISRPIYKDKFLNQISSFENFNKLICYPNITNKNTLCLFNGNPPIKENICINPKENPIQCDIPCVHNFRYKNLYENINEEEMYQIYTEIRSRFEYDNTKCVRYGSFNNRPAGISISGEAQYTRNCLSIFSYVLARTTYISKEKNRLNNNKI